MFIAMLELARLTIGEAFTRISYSCTGFFVEYYSILLNVELINSLNGSMVISMCSLSLNHRSGVESSLLSFKLGFCWY